MELFFCSFNTNLLREKTKWGEGWGQGKAGLERESFKSVWTPSEVSETVCVLSCGVLVFLIDCCLAQTGTDAILQE